ncbi:MAG: hypothetical protein LBU34_00600 [Planctomycetaceae bacterium]|nr:hypothetical protein [Planctomycetaceae bacterium]
MSQDNENKTDEPDFDFNFEEENNENKTGELFSDNPFNSAFSDETETSQNETELPENENLSFPPIDESLGEIPSTFLAENSEETTADATSAGETQEETNPAEINIDSAKKTGRNKKDKEKKPKKERKPIEIGAGLSLTLSGLLLLGLIAFNVYLLVFQPHKDIGVSFSSTIYYLVGFDLVAGFGLVAVPFLFYRYRKENDLFQTMLGISVMALSFAVLLLMTEVFRYDNTPKPASALPTIAPVVLSNPVPVE